MAASTIYDIRLRYMMEDRASGGLRSMNRELGRAGKSAGLLSGGLKRAAAGAVAFFGVRAAKSALIDYNANLQTAKTTMAGLVNITTKSGWDQSMKASSAIVAELEQRAKKTTATTAELVGFSRETVMPLMQAGMHTKDLAEFTANAVTAAKAFGAEEIAALDIQQALTKGVEIRDRFTMNLLRTVGKTKEEFNEMNKAQRLAFLQAAVNAPAVTKMAEEQSKTFSGVWSTFMDNMQIFMGKVGSKLFTGLSETLAKWNQWLDKNEKTVQRWATKLGDALVSAFSVIKSVVSFFVEHADTLILVAKAWAGIKIGRMMGGFLGGGAQGGGGFLQRMGGGLLSKGFDRTGMKVAGFGATLSTVGGVVARFAGPIGLAAGALKGIYDWWNKTDPEKQKKRDAADVAASGIIELRKQMMPLMERRLEMLGTKRLDPFRGEFGTTEGVAGRGFGQLLGQLKNDRYIMGSGMENQGRGKVLGKETLSSADRLQMELNAEKLEELNKGMTQAQESLALWALEQGLFTSDLEGVRSNLLGDMNYVSNEMGLSSEQWTKVTTGLYLMERQIKEGTLDIRALLARARRGETDDDTHVAAPAPAEDEGKAPKVSVTINRIEVESNDPDRFVFGMVESFRDYRKNPNQSLAGIAGNLEG